MGCLHRSRPSARCEGEAGLGEALGQRHDLAVGAGAAGQLVAAHVAGVVGGNWRARGDYVADTSVPLPRNELRVPGRVEHGVARLGAIAQRDRRVQARR